MTFNTLNEREIRLQVLTTLFVSCFESTLVLEKPLCTCLYCAMRRDGGIMLLMSCATRNKT